MVFGFSSIEVVLKKTISGILFVGVLLVVGLYASGWAPRDLGTLESRAVGHWEVVKQANVQLGSAGATEYYFGPLMHQGRGRFIQRNGSGSGQEGSWKVVQSLPEQNRLRLEVEVMGSTRMVTVDLPTDGKVMLVGGPLGLLKATQSELKYKNAETSPALLDVDEVQERLHMFK